MKADIFYFVFVFRVFLNIEKAALFTIYFYLENLKDVAMEIRVLDKHNNSTVFISSRAYGKMALIPAVFLDPNYNKSRKSKYYDNIIS